MKSYIDETDTSVLVAVGLERAEIKQLLASAVANATLPNKQVARFYCSTLKTRSIDSVALSVGADICIGLRPDNLQLIYDRPMCFEFHPQNMINGRSSVLKWDGKQVKFLFFNSEVVNVRAVLATFAMRDTDQTPLLGDL